VNDQIFHATPKRTLGALRRCGFVSQSFADNLRFGQAASPGRPRNFRKELIGDFNGERFHPGKTYCRSDKTTTPSLSRRTYSAKEQVIQARLVEYHHSVAPFGTPAFVG
jgi:hypothetical protein